MANPDNAFGPTLPSAFDFTILFEQSILSLLPTTLFLLLSAFRLRHLATRSVVAFHTPLLWLKLVSLPSGDT
jgi:ATP-binding cassette subfamily C (CFTR/MRP) protein 1